MRRSGVALLLAIGVLAACDDEEALPSAPGDTTVEVTATDLVASTSGDDLVCTSTLRAVAEGEGAAAWTGASSELIIRGETIREVTLPHENVAEFFGAPRIEAGETREGVLVLAVADTFLVTYRFDYVSGGNERSDTVVIDCWP